MEARAQAEKRRAEIIANSRKLGLKEGALFCPDCNHSAPEATFCMQCGSPLLYIAPEQTRESISDKYSKLRKKRRKSGEVKI